MNTAAWLSLFIAGLFEIAWAVSMKYSAGFSKLWPSLMTMAAMFVSLAFLSYALQRIPIGTAYAIWVGIGAAGVAILGIVWFDEPASPARIGCILLIVAGTVGLKFLGTATAAP